MIGSYTLNARLYPMAIVFLPVFVLGVVYSVEFQSYFHALSSIGIVGALTYLLSQISRDLGKRKEKGLWESWGGAPTTQILRFNNSRIDIHTKTRYHAKLQAKCPVAVLPDHLMENTSPAQADEIYAAWTTYLRGQTRDAKKFSLLHKEKIGYGFRRNLWALKLLGIFVTGTVLLGNFIYLALENNSLNLALFPKPFFLSSFLSVVILIFWIFVCKRTWITPSAYAYAERLVESIDAL